MKKIETQKHVDWICKYHVIITPKYRKKVLYGGVRKRIGEILRTLAQRKGIEILEGHAMPDHIHIAISIPPKYSVANVIGYLKGKSAIRIHQEMQGAYYKNYWNKNFWARGYYVTTIGIDEKKVMDYIRRQEYLEKKEEGTQIDMGWK